MSEFKIVDNLTIKSDEYFVRYMIDACTKREIEFIKDSSSLINQLQTIDLHYQGDLLKKLWKCLIEDAISYLKEKDTREEYHDRRTIGTKELSLYMEEFQSFEPILYGVIPHYRDHIAHVFRVYFLGQYYIKKAIGFENIAFEQSSGVTASEKEAMWCIMALTHDLGYSLEKMPQINNKVRAMLQKFGKIPIQDIGYGYFTLFGTVSDFVVKFASSSIVANGNKYNTHIQAKYYQKFLAALANFNHGLMSSVILMKELVFFKESDYVLDENKLLEQEDARQFLIRREILRAIAAHSCEDVYYLGVNNFSFLLTVFDEMQEWGRPRLVDIFKRGESSTALTINKFDGEIVDYKVIFTLDQAKSSPKEREVAKTEVKDYYDAKVNKWLNVLRSAVGGKQRKLKLYFEVEDAIIPDQPISYYLSHENPETVSCKKPNKKAINKLKGFELLKGDIS